MTLHFGKGRSWGHQNRKTQGGTSTPAPPAAMLATSRVNQMGYNGYAGSDGTDTNSNTRVSVWNETGATVTKLIANYCNWMANATNEADGFNAITVTGSFEYPAGTFNQFTWSSSASVSIPATQPGNLAPTDELTLSTPWPAGAQGWMRSYVSVSAAQKWVQGYQITTGNGEACDFSGGIDKTMSGTITNATATANRRGYGPASLKATAFTGTPVTKAFAGLGDSIIMGSTDVADSAATGKGNLGYMGKACATNYPYLNLGIAGTQAQSNLAANMPRRLALLAASGITHVFADYGVNDITSARTAVQISGNISSIAAAIKGAVSRVKVVWATITPKTTGTYLTAAGQTIALGGFTGGAASVRGVLNAAIRAGLSSVDTYFEAADAVEVDALNALTRDGGKWISGNLGVGATSTHLSTGGTSTDGATQDGLHPQVTNTSAPQYGGVYILRDAVRAVFAGW